jgi:hypothetical protein
MTPPRRRLFLALGFSFVVIGLASLTAQERGGRGGFGGPRGPRGGPRRVDQVVLLGVEKVRKELALTEEQRGRIDQIIAAQRERPPERNAGRARASEKETERQLATVLDPPQHHRLREILLQQRGPEALEDARVLVALGLEDEQREKIQAALQWEREQQGQLFGGRGRGPGGPGGGRRGDSRGRPKGEALEELPEGSPNRDRRGGMPNFAGMRARRDQLRKDVQAKVVAILTTDQQKEFEMLKGEAFELDRRSLFGRRGRRRGGRRGPGGRFRPGEDGPVRRQEPEEVTFEDGTGTVPDRATFDKLSYQGAEVLIDTHLDGLQFVKFQIDRTDAETTRFYFINTKTHRAHMMFMSAVGLPRDRETQMRGVLVYRPLLRAPSGQPGMYTYEFEPNDSYSFEDVDLAYGQLVAHMPLLGDRLGYYPMPGAMARYEREKPKYDGSRIRVVLEDELYADIAYLPLNPASSFGRLRLMEPGERPTSRDIVLYKTLPSELPRVAGVITGVRQTPLSHVNLRAIQDKVPNAYIEAAWENAAIAPLIGKSVYYRVSPDVFELREASREEIEEHFDALPPNAPQVPERDLSVAAIRPLGELSFKDSRSVGVKAANVATLRTFGLGDDAVPDGFAVSFYFYDEFMKHNGFYKVVAKLLEEPAFRAEREYQELALKRLRGSIRGGDMPDWMMDRFSELQKSFPAGISIRCRSSTNNEDLPGFSGAGLYDSFTHHPSEGHLSKSIKQVFASLWNFRSFEEREFYRIDHLATAMGVLVHPAFQHERANGVAVSSDVLYQTAGHHYINVQVGEDLVTNPEAESVPEEVLVDWWDGRKHRVMRRSNRKADAERILTDVQLEKLRSYLGKIHGKFSKFYGHSPDDEDFAIEVEFKVTSDGTLLVKQARPWVF